MKRKIAIAVITITIIVAGFLFAIRVNQNDSESDTSQQQHSSIDLQGTSDATQLDPTDNEIAKEAIEDMVRHNEPDNNRVFTAVVRKDSITRSTTSYGAPKLRYIVDIPELQRTFVVEREGDDSSTFASIYVRCPNDSDLRYPAKTCAEIE